MRERNTKRLVRQDWVDIDGKEQIDALLEEITRDSIFNHPEPDTGIPLPMRSIALPALGWDPKALERRLTITLPEDLRALWEQTSGLILLEDLMYRQWGLVVYSPDQALVRHRRFVRQCEERLPGDFAIGEFLGSSETPIARCDPTADDYGRVIIAQPFDPREEWPVVAASVGEFLYRFFQSNLIRFGEMYWW